MQFFLSFLIIAFHSKCRYNIISYENVDETKHGDTRNIGMVTDVDDSGRVKRIMQQNKMLEAASKREDVIIYNPEEEKNDRDNN